MNLIKTLERIINLDHVSTIAYSTTPEPRVTIHVVVPPSSDGSAGTVTLQGAEAVKLIDDLTRMEFISPGLCGEAAQQERERRQQELQKMTKPARTPSKVRIDRTGQDKLEALKASMEELFAK